MQKREGSDNYDGFIVVSVAIAIDWRANTALSGNWANTWNNNQEGR